MDFLFTVSFVGGRVTGSQGCNRLHGLRVVSCSYRRIPRNHPVRPVVGNRGHSSHPGEVWRWVGWRRPCEAVGAASSPWDSWWHLAVPPRPVLSPNLAPVVSDPFLTRQFLARSMFGLRESIVRGFKPMVFPQCHSLIVTRCQHRKHWGYRICGGTGLGATSLGSQGLADALGQEGQSRNGSPEVGWPDALRGGLLPRRLLPRRTQFSSWNVLLPTVPQIWTEIVQCILNVSGGVYYMKLYGYY